MDRIAEAVGGIGPYRLVKGPLKYAEDGLATQHDCPFTRDKRFREAYEAGKATGSWGKRDIRWRAHVACWAASTGTHIAGDFVECGVNRGGLAMAIIKYVDFAALPKTFYLLDTYCGLSESQITDDEKKNGIHTGGYEECYEEVLERFAPHGNVRVVRGIVPETLSEVKSEKIAFLSLDMNCTAPEIAAARHFWDRLEPGAIILLDDYGWKGHGLQRKTFDAFAAKRGVGVLSLPTGQGIIVKP